MPQVPQAPRGIPDEGSLPREGETGMEIAHVAHNEDGSVTVTWDMTVEEFKQLMADAMNEMGLGKTPIHFITKRGRR